MTEEQDQLSQWRGYGDDSKGVAIGFKCEELRTLDGLHFKHVTIIYDHGEQDRIVSQSVDEFKKLIRSMDGTALNDGEKWGPKLAFGFFQVSYLHSIRFKGRGWKEEREWRAIVMAKKDSEGCFSRTRGGELISCYELKIPNLQKMLAQVILGPRSSKSSQKLALDAFRVRENYSFTISESEIPMKP